MNELAKSPIIDITIMIFNITYKLLVFYSHQLSPISLLLGLQPECKPQGQRSLTILFNVLSSNA